MVDLDFISQNATIISTVLIIGSMAYAGITVFARWIAGKFLAKLQQQIDNSKIEVNKSLKAQEDLLYDTTAKFDVTITKLGTSFNIIEKGIDSMHSEIKDVKKDVHDVGNRVNDHLVKSAIKWTELDNKLVYHDNKFDHLQDKFSNFMNRQDTEQRNYRQQPNQKHKYK